MYYDDGSGIYDSYGHLTTNRDFYTHKQDLIAGISRAIEMGATIVYRSAPPCDCSPIMNDSLERLSGQSLVTIHCLAFCHATSAVASATA